MKSTKSERQNLKRLDGRLSIKRFDVLTNDRESMQVLISGLEKIHLIGNCFNSYRGITLYGSHTKGYATHESDIDGIIYFDNDAVSNQDKKRVLDVEDIKDVSIARL